MLTMNRAPERQEPDFFDRLSEDMDDFIRWWTEKGVGWIVETVDAELLIVHAYIGSSRYTTQEMSVLIENLVDSAKELGISTKSDEEIDSLIRSWGNG